MNGQVQLVVVRNPFDRACRDERVLPLDGSVTIADMVREHLPVCPDISVAINGELITKEEWESRTLRPGEQMVVAPVVHGDDSGILSMVLMVALAVVAPMAASWLMGGSFVGAGAVGFAATGFAGTLLTMGIGMVGSMVIGGLMAPSKPSLPNRQSFDNSQSYAWAPVTTQTPGGAVARAYGTHKLYGNIIAGYVENTGDTGKDQIAHLLIDLGTGPYSQLRDFKINDQPIGYYSGVTVTARMGNVNQDIIPSFNDTVATHQINAKVVKNTPVTRDTASNNFDALEIVLTCPQGLWYSNNSGGMDTVSVNVAVEISADGGATWHYVATEPRTVMDSNTVNYWSAGSWTEGGGFGNVWDEWAVGSTTPSAHVEGEHYNDPLDRWWGVWRWITKTTSIATLVDDSITLSGASQQPIRRTLRVDNLVRGTTYKVRVTNLTDDQTSSRYGDDVYLAEINEVLYDDFQYPRTVLAAVDALATNQLSGSIKFSCIGDCAIVRVWNGSAWSSTWSNNPAWVCWDILTQPVLDNSLAVVRYDGLDPSRLILASFYAWAQFCDTLVPDGKGGTEKRCTFDGIFDTHTTMWDAALEVCGSARAQLVRRGTSVMVVVDDVRSTPAQLFNVGNTSANSFNETWLKMEDRAASIEVDMVDAARDYERSPQTVINTNISESTAQRTQWGARGVTRISQGWREASFRLARNELLKRSASISVDIDSLACTVGDLIWLQSDVTQWGEGGRAGPGSTTTQLVLDKPVTLDVGKTYELKLRLIDDTLLTRTITTAAGTVSAVDVSVAFPSAPSLYDPWAIGETNKAVKEFIVLDIARDGEQRAKLSLLEYNASLYGLDSGIPALPTPNVSSFGLPTISATVVEEVLERASDGTILVHIDMHFTVVDAEKVIVYENGVAIGVTGTGIFRRKNVTGGKTYSIQCAPVSAVGASPLSQWKTVVHTVIGKSANPADVTGFALAATPAGVGATWNDIADIDRSEYEIVLAGNAFGGDDPAWRGDALSTDLGILPVGTHTYWIKAIDTSLNYSTGYASASVTVSAPSDPTVTNSFVAENAILAWSAPASTFEIKEYEVRYGGTDWGDAISLGRMKGTTFQVKVDWAGARVFRVAAYDVNGVGADGSVTVTPTNAPVMSVTAQIIGVKAALTWSVPTGGSLPVRRYEMRHGASYAAGAFVAQVDGTTYRVPIDWTGDRTFWVAPIDSADNTGSAGSVVVSVDAPAAPGVSGAISGVNAGITWSAPSATLPIASYEVRHGASWAAGASLGTINGTRFEVAPAVWLGSRTFWVAAIDLNGNVGAAGSTSINITAAPAPILTQQVVDNNVLLYWTQVAGTLPTETYEFRRGSTWAGATEIGVKSGGFTTVFETVAGTYTYWAAAIDSAGNYGTPASVTTTVSQPPDYVLKANYNTTFSGTKSAMEQDVDGSWLIPMNATETYQAHFTSRSWTSPQDQVTAGYAIFAQPSATPGYYEEVIDYGTVLTSSKITITANIQNIVGTPTATCDISVSTDGVSYTTYSGVWSVYATNFRYIKYRITVTTAAATDFARLVGINVRLDSKLKTITGTVSCNSGDSGGTTVYLTNDRTSGGTKEFVDVDAIQVTALGTSAIIAIYDFTDAPNPLSFKILLFNTSGARVSGTASYTIRGF